MKTLYRVLAGGMAVALIAGLSLAVSRPASAAFENSPIGYASLNGGTTGGAGGTSVTVTSGAALQSAIDNKGSQPLVINVQGRLTYSEGRVEIEDLSDLTIIGVGSGGELDGFGLTVHNTYNLIIRNLKIHHVAEADGDAISISENVTNVWVDHNELYSDRDHDQDFYDGLLDITHADDYITVSWNVFHTHWKTSLIGHSDSNAAEDQGHFRITYHHNYFNNLDSRTPSNRFGQVHVFNNYIRNVNSGVSSRMGACTRIERNYFDGVGTSVRTDQSEQTGSVQLIDNIFVNSGSPATSPSCSLSVPYSYSADPVAQVPSIVTAGAGVGKLGQNPPTAVPPTSVPPTSVPPTSVPPTSVPPTSVPPTWVPPTAVPPTGVPTTSAPGVYQAENATLGGGVTVENEYSGFSGSGYVNFPSSGGFVEFRNVDGATGGSRTLRFRFALGATSARTGQLTVNGATQNITFQPTGAWATWATQQVVVNLNGGASNTIRLQSTGQDLANQDQLEVVGSGNPPTSIPSTASPTTLQAESATLGGGVTVETEHSGFSGSGYVNFPSSGGFIEYRNVNGGTGGSRTLQFRFALGVTSARAGQLVVNGATQNITFQPTGGWASWSTMTVTVTLNAGTSNTIRLQSTGQDLANQDQMTVGG